MSMKPDPQNGEKIFTALRELEIQFLNGGFSVQTSIQKLLKDHKAPYVNELSKYLIAQSIVKRDDKSSTHKKPYYWYSGPKLSVRYCNDLILQMKLERAADEKIEAKTQPVRDTNTYLKDGKIEVKDARDIETEFEPVLGNYRTNEEEREGKMIGSFYDHLVFVAKKDLSEAEDQMSEAFARLEKAEAVIEFLKENE